MPRQPRLENAGGIHHVMNRGRCREAIFLTDGERSFFLRELQRAVSSREWNCLAYCLMDNHFHLVLETPHPNLGDGMRSFMGRFVQTVNHWRDGDGPMFRGRFKSVPVRSDDHLARLLRYVALNPVSAGLCEDPSDWLWSSHRATVARPPSKLVAVDRIEELLESHGGAAGTRYRELLAPEGRYGTWADATSPCPPRPPLVELIATRPLDEAMRAARWEHGYRVADVAAAAGVSEATVSRRTAERTGSVPILSRRGGSGG